MHAHVHGCWDFLTYIVCIDYSYVLSKANGIQNTYALAPLLICMSLLQNGQKGWSAFPFQVCDTLSWSSINGYTNSTLKATLQYLFHLFMVDNSKVYVSAGDSLYSHFANL